ncbi:MAG: SDR family oxidoreductase [Hyphomicrobiales bacterium]|nr:SDR family oxidoreductase [Hyphomicrobiales bacterium]
MPPAPRLRGQTALITGASRGIGLSVAKRFAAEGANVMITHVGDGPLAGSIVENLHEISRAEGFDARHLAREADVGDPAAAQAVVHHGVAHFGRLDCLVNNAGIQAPTPSDGWDDATFARIIAVTLMGAAYSARAVLQHFHSHPGGGTIINTSSVHEIIPKPGYLAYSLAKGGLGNLTRTLALESAASGVRVNAVAPGAVLTDMNASWAQDPQAKARVEAHIPLGRAATPEEIAGIFAFLASSDAAYITGQTIYACGGLTLYGDFLNNWAS